MLSHQTSHSAKLRPVLVATFIDCIWAETQLKRQLKAEGLLNYGEHFNTSVEHIKEIISELLATEASTAQHLFSGYAFLQAADYFEGETTRPSGIPAALELLLDASVKQSNLSVRVDALIKAALLGSQTLSSFNQLKTVGLVLVPGCSCVVFDKMPGSRLESFFEKTPAARSWRKQLAPFAALDSTLTPIKCSKFQASVMASFDLKDMSCRE